MLKIGFANKYYTLWNVYDLDGWTHYEYQQNLSFDFNIAVQKAGTKDYDEFLKGESKSFKIAKVYEDLGGNTIIDFGKYSGSTLDYIVQNDYSYIEWLIDNCCNTQLRSIIQNLDIVKEKENQKTQETAAWLKSIQEIPVFEIDSKIELTITFDRNLSFFDGLKKAMCRQNLETRLTVDLLFNDSKEFFYNGHSYWLPTINGKAKRIKGKTIKIIGIAKDIDISKYAKLQQIEVQSFKILKEGLNGKN